MPTTFPAATATAGPALATATRRAVRAVRALPWLLLAGGLALIFVAPLAALVPMAFRTGVPGGDGDWTSEPFRATLSDPTLLTPILNSIVFAVASSVLAVLIASYLVFLATRTRVRFRRIITPVMTAILATPVLFFALSWSMLGADRVGLFNATVSAITGSPSSVFTIASWPGLIFVMAIKLSALSYFLLYGAIRSVDPVLEEAAQLAGAGPWYTSAGVLLRLVLPTIGTALLIGFIAGLQAFDTPQLIGVPAGIRVLSTEIFVRASSYPADYAGAATIALGLVLVLAGLVLLQFRLVSRASHATVGGKPRAVAGWSFGRWNAIHNGIVVVFAVVAFGLPALQLVLSSLNSVFGRYDRLTLRNYERLLDDPHAVTAFATTAVFMVGGGLLTVLLGAALGYLLRRRRTWWKSVLELPTWIPWAVPGLVFALALLGIVLAFPVLHPLYGTPLLMGIALVIAALPTAMRFTENTVTQIDPALLEAARLSGASAFTAFARVFLPLSTASLLAGWFVTGLGVAGNLEIPLLLGSTSVTTVAGLAYKYFVDSAAPVAAAVFCLLLVLIAALLLAAAAVYGGWRAARAASRRTRTRTQGGSR